MKNSITLLLLLCSIICLVPEANGEKFYWVGGSGSWNDPAFTNWSKTSGMTDMANRHSRLPGPDDEVIFDLESFTGSGQTVVLPIGVANCKDFTWTNITTANSPTLHFPANSTLNVYGTFSLDKDVQITYVTLSSALIVMKGTDEDSVLGVFGAGVEIPNIEFNAVDGRWAVTRSTTSPDTLKVAGTLKITEGNISSNNDGFTRFIKTSIFVFDGENASANLSNMDITATSRFLVSNTSLIINQDLGNLSIIKTPWFDIDASNTFDFGALVLTGNNPILDASSQSIDFKGNVTLDGKITSTILGSHTFSANLTLAQSGSINKLEAGKIQTFSNGSNIEGTGANCSNYFTLISTIDGSAASVSKPLGDPIDLQRFYIQDIHAEQAGQFTASLSINLGNNDLWTFVEASSNNYYWVGGTGNWSNGDNWQIEEGSTGCLPTAGDNVFFDENSFDEENQVVTVDLPAIYFNNMTWTDPKQTGNNFNFPVWSIPSADVYVGGSLELAPTMSVNSFGTIHFVAESGNQTITAADDDGMGFDLNNVIFEGGGIWTLGGALLTSQSILFEDGTFDTSTSNYDVNAATISIDGNSTNLVLNDSKITTTTFEILSIGTINAGTSNILTQNFDITPSGLAFYEVLLRGDEGVLRGPDLSFRDVILSNEVKSTVYGSHSYSNLLQFDKPGMIVEFEAGTTQEIGDLESLGQNCGDQLIYVRTTQSGSAVNFVSTGGNISVSYLALQDNVGSPEMAFTASRSQNLGNTSGWDFSMSADTRYFFWRGGTGDWNDASNWRYATNLAQSPNQSGCIPTPSDDVTFDADSFSDPNDVVTLDGAEQYCRTMTWGDDVIGVPTMKIPTGNSLNIYGGLRLATSTLMTMEFEDEANGILNFKATTNDPINRIITANHTIPNLRFEGPGGGWQLNGGLTVGENITLINGLLNTANFAVSANQFIVDGAGAALSLGSSNLDITSKFEILQMDPVNFDAGTSTITTNILTATPSGLTFYDVQMVDIGLPTAFDADLDTEINGSSIIFNSLILSGTENNIIHGSNTFNALLQVDYNSSLTVLPRTKFIFDGGSTQTFGDNATIFSNSDNFDWPTIEPSSGTATFFKNGGAVCMQFIRIVDIITSGTALFGYNNTNAYVSDPFGLGWTMTTDCEAFLPVDCIDFAAAVKTDNSVELYWITAQEINNSGFEVQRSTDGRRFETIAWIDGTGTTSETQKYTYIDRRTEGFTEAYYRIKQIDFDGTAAFACDIQAVNFRHIGDGPLQVFPNPAGELIQVRWFGQKTGTTILRLFDQSGRLVIDREWSSLEGNNQRELPVKDLPKGIYELQLVNGNGQMQATRVVKQ